MKVTLKLSILMHQVILKTLDVKKQLKESFKKWFCFFQQWIRIPLMLEQNFKWTRKIIIPIKILNTGIYCAGWFSKIAFNKVMKNKLNLIKEDKYWKFLGDVISMRNEGLDERLSFEVKSGGSNFLQEKESESEDVRGKFVTFSCLR